MAKLTISNKRVHELIDAGIEIEKAEAKEAGELGYMPRLLVQTTLPYRDPKTKIYERQNGELKLSLLSPNGVPFGSIPRYLVSYLSTEAVRTKSPVISLGQSQNDFVRLLGMNTAGGAQKNRVKQQCKRFFTTLMTAEVTRRDGIGQTVETMENVMVAKRAFMFWQPGRGDEQTLWESSVELTSDFFDECVQRPVPVDLRVLDALSASPMAMDLYTWLTYRVVRARKVSTVPWGVLITQFGNVDRTEVRTFRRQFLAALKQVEAVSGWHPAISVDDTEGLTIYPGKGHVRTVGKR